MSKATRSCTPTFQTDHSPAFKLNTWLYPVVLATAILFTVVQSGCGEEKVPGDTGIGVLSPGDLIGLAYTDTSTIEMETQIIDKVSTGNRLVQLIGNYIDPQFGQISSKVFTEFRLPGVEVEFGEASRLEFTSLTLEIQVLGSYGRFQSLQTVNVYELDEKLPDDIEAQKSSSRALRTKGPELSGRHQIDYREKSSISHLTIPLSDELGKRILFADNKDLLDNEAFSDFFKGLAISTEDVGYLSREPGAIFTTFLDGAESFMHLQYKYQDTVGGNFNPKSFVFIINEDAKKYYTIKRTLGPDNLLSTSHVGANPNEFVQSGALIKLFVSLPYVKNLGEVGVNNAVLKINVDPEYLGTGNRFVPPRVLRMLLANSDRTEERNSSGNVITNTEATFDAVDNSYNFQVTNYLQEILGNKRPNNGFIMVAPDSSISVNRAVLAGVDHPTLAPVLKITYTTLPK